MRALLVSLSVLLFVPDAIAASGDTFIFVAYKVNSVRIKPQPVAGVGSLTLRAVLHADGTVDDVIEAKGGNNKKKYEQKDRRLGSQTQFTGRWRVIDQYTLERRSIEKNHDYVVKVIVKGKSCAAEVSYALHAGQKEYYIHSAQLDQMAYFSKIQPFDVKCKIE
ncbi:hypothetical protein [Bradyrhizobium sp.]|uniref:hypothetical protein n=1 Tax=Bradyrhizobium sp. TaxID=376 RepID=UPI001D636A6C|nr:hypothetical protein [Bradyrhizobium sp.]MBI5318344.1 hypothetical protein [Bradyrhizobium sp.]